MEFQPNFNDIEVTQEVGRAMFGQQSMEQLKSFDVTLRCDDGEAHDSVQCEFNKHSETLLLERGPTMSMAPWPMQQLLCVFGQQGFGADQPFAFADPSESLVG